jgi:hypothetical protein
VVLKGLKAALIKASALTKINYFKGVGDIILTINASITGWGAVL